ncbi:hypothetical protein G6O67_004861 [Ophiocordyceps sinensis]|uniref:Uncharacterized protein n=1 Tax=Ophiocordyceps sinensis TaxID=72228 RepID=A0A8H4PQA7_9HYPO|nr:hypothetical protein G6O67_004861 [Ophiocordyceps sinensis]
MLRQLGPRLEPALFLDVVEDVGGGGEVELADERVGLGIDDGGAAVALNADAAPDPRLLVAPRRRQLLDEPLARRLARAVLLAADIRRHLAHLPVLVARGAAAGHDGGAGHDTA